MAQSKKTTSKNTKKTTKSASSKSKAKKPVDNTPPPEAGSPYRREIAALVFFLLAIFTLISYFTSEGAFIVFFSDFLRGLLGWGFWISAPVFFLCAIILTFHKGRPVALRFTSTLLLMPLFAAMAHLLFYDPNVGEMDFTMMVGILFEQGQSMTSGGVMGGLLAQGLKMAFSIYGAFPILLVAFLLCLIAGLNTSLKSFFVKLKSVGSVKYDPAAYEKEEPLRTERTAPPVREKKTVKADKSPKIWDIPLGDDTETLELNDLRGKGIEDALKDTATKNRLKAKIVRIERSPSDIGLGETEDDTDFKPVPLIKPAAIDPINMSAAEISDPPKSAKLSRAQVEAEAQAMAEEISASAEQLDYEFPPLTLLRGGSAVAVDAKEEILINRERLEGAIHSFGIHANIVGVTRGPTVTRYDIELEQGVKLARVTNLAGDIALALGVINVRIAPIPDKISTVGIEVPNKIVSTVYLRDIIESPKFSSAKSRLSFALGKDIGGDCIVGNISKLPHMLIAGTTGSGKSVCMNSLILSLLYKARPDEVRLIMIDPKMVELGVYNGIPHLYVPVVTDPKKAAGALQWSVVEMLKRYRSFSEVGVRDLESYNRYCLANDQPSLPQVVIVIDELADLMLVASKEVEESICRVAQMGRAAGMHLVIATQRPSADVITGLMKANIPSRIAFAVSSAMESRIILDQAGAEKLVGMGDMLFSPVGSGKPTRIQGAFVSDEEREEVIQFIKDSAGSAQQNSEIEEYMNKAIEDKHAAEAPKKEESPAGNFDEMLPQAVEVVLETKQASVSMLQRRIKLGYSRAARIVDQMEELGIVGPYEGAKPRSVLVDREGWRQIQLQLGMIDESDMALAAELNEDNYTE